MRIGDGIGGFRIRVDHEMAVAVRLSIPPYSLGPTEVGKQPLIPPLRGDPPAGTGLRHCGSRMLGANVRSTHTRPVAEQERGCL